MVGRPAGVAGLDYVSYSGSSQAIAAVNNPWDAYASLVALNGSTSDSAEARARVQRKRESVLDLVRTQFDRLRQLPLSVNDREKLDLHFTAVREVEVQLSATGLACVDADLETRATPFQGNTAFATEEPQYPLVADL